MTVADLIEYLQAQPQDIRVAYCIYSEYALLDADAIEIKTLCKPRPDGWIQERRDDMEEETYLVLPGN